MSRETEELVRVLGAIPGTRVKASQSPAAVVVEVQAIGDALRIDPATVAGLVPGTSPTGAPAVQVILEGNGVVIVTVDDVVFPPADPSEVLESAVPRYTVVNAPDLVAYTEMSRDLHANVGPVRTRNPDYGGATLLLHRCFLAGALKVGLRPVALAELWNTANDRWGSNSPLPPFRDDPAWRTLFT